jgi:hypothetical protein
MGSGATRGIAEYGINCGTEAADDPNTATIFGKDDSYLESHFQHLLVWNIWDVGGCKIDNSPPDEPLSVQAWQSIEAGN